MVYVERSEINWTGEEQRGAEKSCVGLDSTKEETLAWLAFGVAAEGTTRL